MDSILTSIKKLLGPSEESEHFDPDIIMHINSAISTLTQIGVGPTSGFSIKGKEAVWNDFIPEDPRFESIKTYIYLSVKLVFDPPLNSAVLEAMKGKCSEYEWRLQVAADATTI